MIKSTKCMATVELSDGFGRCGEPADVVFDVEQEGCPGVFKTVRLCLKHNAERNESVRRMDLTSGVKEAHYTCEACGRGIWTTNERPDPRRIMLGLYICSYCFIHEKDEQGDDL